MNSQVFSSLQLRRKYFASNASLNLAQVTGWGCLGLGSYSTFMGIICKARWADCHHRPASFSSMNVAQLTFSLSLHYKCWSNFSICSIQNSAMQGSSSVFPLNTRGLCRWYWSNTWVVCLSGSFLVTCINIPFKFLSIRSSLFSLGPDHFFVVHCLWHDSQNDCDDCYNCHTRLIRWDAWLFESAPSEKEKRFLNQC